MQTLDLSNHTILVADPSQYMVKILRTMLRGFGVNKIYEAQDGAAALEVLKIQTINIAIIDQGLTTLTGVELVELLRGDERNNNRFLPIIMLSASTDIRRIKQARDAGVTEFLRKPLCAQDLYLRLAQVIKNPREVVQTRNFTGPDRRRRASQDHDGPNRREKSSNVDIDNLFNQA